MTTMLLVAAVWILPPVSPAEIYWPERIVRIC